MSNPDWFKNQTPHKTEWQNVVAIRFDSIAEGWEL